MASRTIPAMDILWTPWRYTYIKSADSAPGCIFCDKPKENDDERNLIVHRGQSCYVILNAFPYTNGHLMVVPFEHEDQLQKLDRETAMEMMVLTQKSESVLRELYRPEAETYVVRAVDPDRAPPPA